MQRHMRADEAVRIKYDSKYAQSANYWKNSMGMNKCIDSIGIIEQKQAYEPAPAPLAGHNGIPQGQRLDFDLLAKYYGERFERMRAFYYWSETFRGTSELVTRALKAGNGMEVKGPDGKPEKQYIEFEDNRDSWDEALDKEVLAALMKNYREHVSEEYLPSFYKTVDTDFNGDYTAYVNHLYKKSVLMKNGKKLYFNKKKFNQDPGVQLGLSLQEYLAEQREALGKTSDSIDIQERYLCAARLQMEQDMPHYSDANMTMRLSYGRVGGFTLNGSPSGYYTTAESIVEKMGYGDRMPDYFAEPIMHELLSANDFGQYQDKATGKMQPLLPHQQRHHGRQQRLADVQRQGRAHRPGLRRQLGQPLERHLLREELGPLHRRRHTLRALHDGQVGPCRPLAEGDKRKMSHFIGIRRVTL